jgi:hypothetical protein
VKSHAISIAAKEQAQLVDIIAPGALGSTGIRGPTLDALISPRTEIARNYTGTTFPHELLGS